MAMIAYSIRLRYCNDSSLAHLQVSAMVDVLNHHGSDFLGIKFASLFTLKAHGCALKDQLGLLKEGRQFFKVLQGIFLKPKVSVDLSGILVVGSLLDLRCIMIYQSSL